MKHTDYFKNFLENTVNLSPVQARHPQQAGQHDLQRPEGRRRPRPADQEEDPAGLMAAEDHHQPAERQARSTATSWSRWSRNPDWADDLKKYGDAIYRRAPQQIALQGHAARTEVPLRLRQLREQRDARRHRAVRGPLRRQRSGSSTATTTSGSAQTPTASPTWMKEKDKIAGRPPAQGHPDHEVPARPQELVHRHQVDPAHHAAG